MSQRYISAAKISFLITKVFNPILKNSWKKYIGLSATYMAAGISFCFETIQN